MIVGMLTCGVQDDVTQCTLRGIIRNGVNLDIRDRKCSLTATQRDALKINDILKGVVYQFCPHSAGNWIKRAITDIILVLESEQLVLMATSKSENLQSLGGRASPLIKKRTQKVADDVIVISSDEEDVTPVLGKRKAQDATAPGTKRPRTLSTLRPAKVELSPHPLASQNLGQCEVQNLGPSYNLGVIIRVTRSPGSLSGTVKFGGSIPGCNVRVNPAAQTSFPSPMPSSATQLRKILTRARYPGGCGSDIAAAHAQVFNQLAAAVDCATSAMHSRAPAFRPNETVSLLSYDARLPNELWALAWEDLAQLDCIAVSQTCRRWRQVALSSPRLWRDIKLVLPDARARSHPSGDYSTRLHSMLTQLLVRSQPMPFSLECHASYMTASTEIPGLSNSFSDALSAHIGRVARIKFDALGSDVFDSILGSLSSLPSLSSLQFTRIRCSEPFSLCTKPLALPGLHSLELTGNFLWPEDGLLDLPALQQLSLPLADIRELSRVSKSCPTLETLRIRLSERSGRLENTGALDAKDIQRVAEAVRGVQNVFIQSDGGDKEVLPPLLDVFRHFPDAPRRTIAVQSHTLARPTAITILADCAQAVSLTCAPSPRDNLIRATDSDGRTREIRFAGRVDSVLRNVWTHVAPSKIAHLSVYLRWWHHLAPDLASMSGLQTLTLVTSQSPCDADLSPLPPPGTVALPALRAIHLQSDNPYALLTVEPGWTLRLLQSLHGQGPLPVLELSRILLLGDRAIVSPWAKSLAAGLSSPFRPSICPACFSGFAHALEEDGHATQLLGKHGHDFWDALMTFVAAEWTPERQDSVSSALRRTQARCRKCKPAGV
ncbi:hypothetical protein AURDEDRAFT_130851 [Auricularia subglabra TFB-10046 SS5]|uniref:Uncharacterized protein n=1 Tax=Auricularia subglabra (strain TFB-10046 / SS5) TaxID=717982 RepID=J0D7D8_AURST|nr:hypothetical protein AURDEDRAFT_130851 [Auricularia subglabra TFB-10046 SS5]